eukprot:923152-Prorocentrum_minimum.AAC.1
MACIRVIVVPAPRVPSRLLALPSLVAATPCRAALAPPMVGIVPARDITDRGLRLLTGGRPGANAPAAAVATAAAGSAGTARTVAGEAKTAAVAH